jgi:hypothetical protein
MDYTAFWNGCQTANERKVKSMTRTETIEKIAELLSTQSIRVCEAIYKAAKNISEPQEEKGGAR